MIKGFWGAGEVRVKASLEWVKKLGEGVISESRKFSRLAVKAQKWQHERNIE